MALARLAGAAANDAVAAADDSGATAYNAVAAADDSGATAYNAVATADDAVRRSGACRGCKAHAGCKTNH